MTNKEAIVWLKECKEHYGEYHEMCDEALDIAIKALAIQALERPIGHWIKEDEFHSKCSLCGFKYADYRNLFDYCPNCGARMEERRPGRE